MLWLYTIPSASPIVTSPVAIFLIVLAVILVVPLVFNRLRIPHVIGLIVAGMVLGPYCSNVLARDMSFEVFGQVGLLYLMFLAGVEIDMYHLKRNLRRGVIFGFLTFAIPMVAGAASAHMFLGMDVLTSVLMASMFAAHTLLAYPIASRFGLTRNRAVVIAVAGTIVTVLGSLLVLAGTVSVAREGAVDLLAIGKLMGWLVLYCVGMVYVVPRLTRWFFKRYNDSIAQFAYVLSIVFLSAEVALCMGLEGVFGAFLAGLVVNRFIPQHSPLMGRLEFVGNALFIPYFLIGVGMLINVQALGSGLQTWYVAAVMSITAMATKWMAALAAQRLFGMNASERSMLYQLTNAHTAVALAVVMIGYKFGIFNETILDGTIVMILITCTVSSMGTARAAQRLKVDMLHGKSLEEEINAPVRQVRTLIPVVNPVTATELVSLAMMMHEKRPQRRHEFYALHVRNDNSPASRAVGQNSLDVAVQTGASIDEKVIPLDRYDLNFVTGVLNVIEERDIHEVVIGLHRRSNVIDSFFGDKLTQLLKATYRQVVISRCYIPVNTLRRIVVWVPDKAEFETGFVRWVRALASLTRQIGCRIVFCASCGTQQAIEAVIRHGEFGIRHEYRTADAWDDFILISNKIAEDDLFVAVSARRASVSFASYLDELPVFLRHYFGNNNLMVIFPEQFGAESVVPTMAEVLSPDIEAAPSQLWVNMIRLWRWIVHRWRKPSKRNIDL